MAKATPAFGHMGLMMGILGPILAIGLTTSSTTAYANVTGALVFPVLFSAVGFLFVVAELYGGARGK